MPPFYQPEENLPTDSAVTEPFRVEMIDDAIIHRRCLEVRISTTAAKFLLSLVPTANEQKTAGPETINHVCTLPQVPVFIVRQ